MSNIDIRIPNIATDAPASQQMAQMRSYMYQLVEQLNWALNAIQGAQNGEKAEVVVDGVDVGDDITQANETTFNSIKGLIIKSADMVENDCGICNISRCRRKSRRTRKASHSYSRTCRVSKAT